MITAEMSTDQGWIGLGQDCIGLQFFENRWIRTALDCGYSNHIKNVRYILPLISKALMGLICYASTCVQTRHIALSSYYYQQGERSRGVSVTVCACCASLK